MIELKYIKHQNIDFVKWDTTILNSKIPFVFAQSFYLNATCPYWDALIIGDYESVFPITYKTKLGYSYLPQPPFTSQLGVYGKVTLEIEKLFYNYIINKFKLIDLELNTFNYLKSEFISQKKTYVLNYFDSYTINQNTKRNISKANQRGLTVKRVEEKDILSFSQKLLNPFLENEVGLATKTISKLDALLINAIKEKKMYSFCVVDQKNSVKALAHFISNEKHTVYLKGTNFDKSENSGSMHLLMHYAITFFENKTMIFDFGGGSKQGLANFYMGFGGKAMYYSFLQVNKLSWLIKLFKK